MLEARTRSRAIRPLTIRISKPLAFSMFWGLHFLRFKLYNVQCALLGRYFVWLDSENLEFAVGNGGLGFLRGYLTSLGASNDFGMFCFQILNLGFLVREREREECP